MDNTFIISDHLIFSPGDVDLAQSPLRNGLSEQTFVLGAFNPGLCRLLNGNLLLMVRVAEALSNAVNDREIHSIRWDKENRYVADSWPLEQTDRTDPRSFTLNKYAFHVCAVTSLSWLLPVELNKDGSRVDT